MTTNSFKGKKAIVIGGSSGIGKATARNTAGKWCNRLHCQQRSKQPQSAAKELGQFGNVLGVKTDITSPSEVESLD